MSSPASAKASANPEAGTEFTGLDRNGQLVFIGLMLGMFLAAISQTIVGPAMPRIVAELGGMEHYSWIATADMLVAAVTVPVVGKLSDMYGRKPFYVAGLIVFMIGSILAGATQSFWFLVFARAIQGFGMGTLMPLSQTIIGDIIPPRQRGKYQGYMGAVFGVSSIAGPLIGGWVTDNIGWRWLFYLALPLGLVALLFVLRNMHLPKVADGTSKKFDFLGTLFLSPGLVIGLLAISWGGTTYAWDSATIITMLIVAAILLAIFVVVELKVENPLLPLDMLKDSTVSISIVASFAIAVAMFGAIIYIPLFAQGVLGESATNSGAILIPLNLSLVVTLILTGMITSRTGRYKAILVVGGLIMVAGYLLLANLAWNSSAWALTGAMVVIGVGIGTSMQTYTLIVQNVVDRSRLGVATAAVQFFRNVGATVGIAILGSVMSSNLQPKIEAQLPASAKAAMAKLGAGGETSALLDPDALKGIPAPILAAIRHGLGDAMHLVFMTAVPFAIVAFILALFVRQVTLRTTNH